jgi:hypothetical protein
MFACLWMMSRIIIVYMVVEGYHALCSSCFVAVWVENLICLLFIYIESRRSIREETRDGNQYCLVFLLWWCVTLLQDLWWCWEGGCIPRPLCYGEFQFPIIIVACLVSLVVISLSMGVHSQLGYQKRKKRLLELLFTNNIYMKQT